MKKKKSNPGPARKVKIPAHLQNEALLYAGQYVKNALGINERDPDFAKAREASAKRFLEDSYNHSLTPHVKKPGGEVAANPYKVSQSVPFQMDFSNVRNVISQLPSKEQEARWASFYSAIASTVHSYLKLKFAWKASELSESGRLRMDMPPMAKNLSAKERDSIAEAIYRNRFIRQITNMLTVLVVDELFGVNGEAIEAVAEAILRTHLRSDFTSSYQHERALRDVFAKLGRVDFANELSSRLVAIADTMQAPEYPPAKRSSSDRMPEEPPEVEDEDLPPQLTRARDTIEQIDFYAGREQDKEYVKASLPKRKRKDKPITKSVKLGGMTLKLFGQASLIERVEKRIAEYERTVGLGGDETERAAVLKKSPVLRFLLSRLAARETFVALDDFLEAVVERKVPNPRKKGKAKACKRKKARDFT